MDSYVFPEPHWVDLRDEKKEFSEVRAEYWRETGFTHPLAAYVGKLVASCPGTGDVVFATKKQTALVIQLTWLGTKSKDGRPEFVECTSADQLADELAGRPRMHWMDSLEFPEQGWDDLRNDPDRAGGLEEELRTELGKGSPRNDALLEVVASAWPQDDVIVKTRGGAAIVHLTWRGRKERPGWPEWADLSQEELEAELQYVAERYDDDEE